MQLLVETEIECPWCFEMFPVVIDTSSGDYETIEDCAVCCRPIQLEVQCSPGRVDVVQSSPG